MLNQVDTEYIGIAKGEDCENQTLISGTTKSTYFIWKSLLGDSYEENQLILP